MAFSRWGFKFACRYIFFPYTLLNDLQQFWMQLRWPKLVETTSLFYSVRVHAYLPGSTGAPTLFVCQYINYSFTEHKLYDQCMLLTPTHGIVYYTIATMQVYACSTCWKELTVCTHNSSIIDTMITAMNPPSWKTAVIQSLLWSCAQYTIHPEGNWIIC